MTKAKESKTEGGRAPEAAPESLLTAAEFKSIHDELERERELRVRALADFDNYRKRVERERARAEHSGKRPIILSLLEVMDDFDRALEHAGQSPDAVVEGLRAIRKRLSDVIKAQGVTPIESVGRPFDPALHEAVGAVDAGDGEQGIVLDEVRPGYFWDGDVLRHAQVYVAK
jgi:molecular chaperone GrpE